MTHINNIRIASPGKKKNNNNNILFVNKNNKYIWILKTLNIDTSPISKACNRG